MDIRFYCDEESGLAHCYAQHGIHEREVIEVLRRPGQRLRNTDGTLVAEGQTYAGRYLRVIYREHSEPDYIFVITAYDMSATAKRAYRRWHRRK
jgi:hypothetical protein